MKKIKIGSKVAFNTLDDAAWFEVVAINGFTLEIKEFDDKGTNYASQYMDRSLVKQVKE